VRPDQASRGHVVWPSRIAACISGIDASTTSKGVAGAGGGGVAQDEVARGRGNNQGDGAQGPDAHESSSNESGEYISGLRSEA
jgi:hypothetical protein